MLELLRAVSKTWIAKIAIFILSLSFGAWGISDVLTSFGSDTIARVGGEDITIKQFQRAYQQQLNSIARQIGKVPTPQEAMAMGIPNQVLANLSANAAIDHVTARLGLGASTAQLARILREDPNFSDSLGNFDRNVFAAVLQQNGYTQAEYFELEAKNARRQQLATAIFEDAPIPKTAEAIVARYTGDKRTLDYFTVGATAIGDIPQPTDEELEAYLKAHQASFRTEEVRTVDLFSFSPEALAATEPVSNDEIEAEYEKEKPNLTKVERRHVEQAVLPDDAAVKAFTDGQAAGESFADIAKSAKLSIADLGTLSKSEISDSELAKTAFSLPLDGIAIIPGIGGKRAVTVTEIQPGGTKTLEEAAPDIRKRIALRKANADYAKNLDKVEAQRAAFKPLAEIAKGFDLPVYHLELTQDGKALDKVPNLNDKDRQAIVAAVFKGEVKKLNPAIALAANRNVWFDLEKVEPARDQTLAEVRDKVVAAWTADKTDAAIKAKADALLKEARSGKSFDDVAAEINEVPQISEPITRTGNAAGVIDRSVAEAAFQGPEGLIGSARNANGDYIVFKVDRVDPNTGDLPEASRTYLLGSIKTDLFNQYLTGIRDAQGLKVNQGALEQVLAVNGQN